MIGRIDVAAAAAAAEAAAAAAPRPRVFLSFPANDHSCEKGGRWGGDSINGRRVNRLVSGGSLSSKHEYVESFNGKY